LQLLAVVEDLIKAGHRVTWIDKTLHQRKVDQLVEQIMATTPDVLLFVRTGHPTQQLMASVAVLTDNIVRFVSAGELRPVAAWRDILCTIDIRATDAAEQVVQVLSMQSPCVTERQSLASQSGGLGAANNDFLCANSEHHRSHES
jgi:hypothetical protein